MKPTRERERERAELTMVIDLPKAIRVPCGLLEASERDVACSLFVCFFFYLCVRVEEEGFSFSFSVLSAWA